MRTLSKVYDFSEIERFVYMK